MCAGVCSILNLVVQNWGISEIKFGSFPLRKIGSECVCVYVCVHMFVCVCVCSCSVSVVTETFLPAWPLQGHRHHQLCQPVKCVFLHSAGYMECKTLEKCVWNLRVTCLKWLCGCGGWGTPKKREDPWQGILFDGIVTDSSGQGCFL